MERHPRRTALLRLVRPKPDAAAAGELPGDEPVVPPTAGELRLALWLAWAVVTLAWVVST